MRCVCVVPSHRQRSDRGSGEECDRQAFEGEQCSVAAAERGSHGGRLLCYLQRNVGRLLEIELTQPTEPSPEIVATPHVVSDLYGREPCAYNQSPVQ